MSQNVQNVPDGQHKKKTFHSTGAIKTTSDRNGFRSSLQYQRCSLVIGPPLDVCLFVFFARVCVRESSTMLFACGSFFFRAPGASGHEHGLTAAVDGESSSALACFV